jgi:hypothetical protein
MTSVRKIRTVAQRADLWLARRQAKHVAMVESSIINLQNSIINQLSTLKVKGGAVEGIRVNLKQAQKIHKRVETLYGQHFATDTKRVVRDFKNVSSLIGRSYSYLGESVAFTSVDATMMDVLRDGCWRQYQAIGAVQKDKVIQAIYNNVIGGGEFSMLVNSIEGALMGSNAVGITGRSLVQYSRLYARDMIMNFHNEVNLKKAEEIKIKHFLYVGDIMGKTRDFCRKRAGKTYTKKQIDSWTAPLGWQGGPCLYISRWL